MTKTKKIGCDFGTTDYSTKSPTIKICGSKPAVFIRSKKLNQEVAVCKRCFALIEHNDYEFKENFQDNPKAEY